MVMINVDGSRRAEVFVQHKSSTRQSRSCVTLYLLACHVRVSAGDSCACCCIRGTSVELIDSPCLSILLPACYRLKSQTLTQPVLFVGYPEVSDANRMQHSF